LKVLRRPIESAQYASAAYRIELEAHRILAGMSGRGNSHDNAVAQSFSATLGIELIMRSDWRTREEARGAIFLYIETW
jgi:putative transposase